MATMSTSISEDNSLSALSFPFYSESPYPQPPGSSLSLSSFPLGEGINTAALFENLFALPAYDTTFGFLNPKFQTCYNPFFPQQSPMLYGEGAANYSTLASLYGPVFPQSSPMTHGISSVQDISQSTPAPSTAQNSWQWNTDGTTSWTYTGPISFQDSPQLESSPSPASSFDSWSVGDTSSSEESTSDVSEDDLFGDQEYDEAMAKEASAFEKAEPTVSAASSGLALAPSIPSSSSSASPLALPTSSNTIVFLPPLNGPPNGDAESAPPRGNKLKANAERKPRTHKKKPYERKARKEPKEASTISFQSNKSVSKKRKDTAYNTVVINPDAKPSAWASAASKIDRNSNTFLSAPRSLSSNPFRLPDTHVSTQMPQPTAPIQFGVSWFGDSQPLVGSARRSSADTDPAKVSFSFSQMKVSNCKR